MKELDLITKISIYAWEELSDSDRELVETAKRATTTAYAPYSHFFVGAAARLDNGVIVQGSNQENAAFPSGLCAERTTLFYANAQYPEHAVTDLAVAAYCNGKFLKSPIPPCGACRQVMLGVEERHNHPMRVLLYGEDGTYIIQTVKELLPLQFTGETMTE